nr:MAG TPA: virulence factor [Caudoviricetes sp.]
MQHLKQMVFSLLFLLSCTLYILIIVRRTIFVNSYFCTLYNFCR